MATYGYCDYGNSWCGPDDRRDRHEHDGVPNNCHPRCPTRVAAACGDVSPPPPGLPPVPLPPVPGGPVSTYPGSSVTVPTVATAYVLPTIGAQALDYTRILLAWENLPQATMNSVTTFRVLASPWGFPVDENDGTVIYEVQGTPPSPGVQLTDTSATPGTVQYYGFYVYNNQAWLRAGFTACLMPAYHGYGDRLMSDLPPYFQNQDNDFTSQDVSVASPPLPSSGGSAVNPYNYDIEVWLSGPAHVMASGIPMGSVTRFPLPAGASLTISYSSPIYWQWISRAVQPQNTALTDFLNVLGFGLDTVKTQYDFKYNSLNDPMTMGLGDLVSLCAQIGLPYNPEIPAYAMRKAALYWGRVMQERGTLAGIAQNITLLTGYPADVQVSRNFMLDNDQSGPVSPLFPGWSASCAYTTGEIISFPVAETWSVVTTYNTGDVVTYNDLLYTALSYNQGNAPTNATYWSQNVAGPYNFICLSNTTPGTQPSGSISAHWALIYGTAYNSGTKYTANLPIAGLSGNAGTWEYLASTGTQLGLNIGVGFPTPQTWPQSSGAGVTGPNAMANTFRAVNNTSGTLSNTWLRSICRSSADVTAGHVVPDPQVIVEHAVPVPISTGLWDSTATYKTNDLVFYFNLNYIALRQSTNAPPPLPGVILNQNYDFEAGLSPWIVGANCTIVQSNAYAYQGFESMALTTTGANGHAASENIPIIPGATYEATALVYSTTTVTSVQIAANWNDPFGAYLGGSFGGVALPANTWTAVSNTFTVPDTAATVWLAPTDNQVGTTTYWDVVQLTCIATPEWGPLGLDSRFPITMSGYGVADLGLTPATSAVVTPFVEWYDNWGNLISRVFARTTSTSGGYPSNYQFDSFNTGAEMPVAGRVPVNPSAVWSVPAGAWTVSTSGAAFAGETDFDAIGVLASPAAGIAAVTVAVPAQSGDDCGVLFWYENASNFWVAGLDALYYVSSGVTRTPIAYTHTGAAWDRIYVQFNNTTSVTTLPGGTTVTGPSAVVYKNTMTASNILVVVGSGGTATQTAMSSLTTPYLPGTGATTSFAGIASITI